MNVPLEATDEGLADSEAAGGSETTSVSSDDGQSEDEVSGSTPFWIEATLAIWAAALFTLTLAYREWIELVFGVDPDGGSGALEWAIVGILVATSAAFSALARVEWSRSVSHRLRLAADASRVPYPKTNER